MHYLKFIIAAALLLNLSACGDKAENQSAGQQNAQTQSSDPRYQNGLLNANPQQFTEILADCGKLMFGEHVAPEEVQLKCRQDMIARAEKLGIKINEANIAEQLVKDRYNFMLREGSKK
ncbi:hypothetical protein HZU75_01890 [Chitinibacter fontanus]|uniref:Lipoprotein n=1 Tax=Chitinibacter fontanus TaxID=1737446 RepID=A0A7D5ZET7_9NEIS|nr:hypothetical protein [Chitinibacter fontanus]QLI80387.1 hypothetical protein HZU75_01890 [Chitinibacter fontanus]